MAAGFLFDNLCVALGVVALSLTRGPGYTLRNEVHRAAKGFFGHHENGKEFLVGLVVLICALASLMGLLEQFASRV